MGEIGDSIANSLFIRKAIGLLEAPALVTLDILEQNRITEAPKKLE